MPRTTLEEARLHPAIRERVATLNADIVHNVQAAAGSNPVLVVGMAGNRSCAAPARRSTLRLAYHYLEYGATSANAPANREMGPVPTSDGLRPGTLVGVAKRIERYRDGGETNPGE